MLLGFVFLIWQVILAAADEPWFCSFSSHCYNDPEPLGCFPMGPFTNFCHQLVGPQDPNDLDVEFMLYTPEVNKDDFQVIDFYHGHLDNTVRAVHYNQSRELWVLIHGFGGTWPKQWIFPMKDALLTKGYNVMLVRWSKGSAAPNYPQAVANTRVVGRMVARVLQVMKAERDLDVSNNVTILGFSLGAHVAGFAGDWLNGDVKKIVGLDPAGPLFAGFDPETRLDPTDAKFVEAMHCNGDSLVYGGAGTLEQMGHVDFYPNGGKLQAGCERGVPQVASDVWHQNWTYVMDDLKCSHVRCAWLYTTSIIDSNKNSTCQFKAFPCTSTESWESGDCFTCDQVLGCAVAGYPTTHDSPYSGKYFFDTNPNNYTTSYFCGEQFKISTQAESQAPENSGIALEFYAAHSTPPKSNPDYLLDPSSGGSLNKGDQLTKILVAPPDFKHINAVYLTYIPAKGSDVPQNLDLNTFTIIDSNERM